MVVNKPAVVINYRLPEAAAMLACTVSFLRSEIREKHITPLRLGKRFVLPLVEIERYQSATAQAQGCVAAVK